MATKTITLEVTAYEKLKRAKCSSKESFSQVIMRGKWESRKLTAKDVLAKLANRKKTNRLLSEEDLDSLDDAQSNPRISDSKWTQN